MKVNRLPGIQNAILHISAKSNWPVSQLTEGSILSEGWAGTKTTVSAYESVQYVQYCVCMHVWRVWSMWLLAWDGQGAVLQQNEHNAT